MTVAQRFFIFLCATMTFNCKADYQLPEPTDVIYRWDDQFHVTVSWSWKMPDNLPEDCTVKYEVVRYGESVEPTFRSLVNNFIEKYFTEDKHSDHWNISIQAVLDPECSHWKKSRPVIKTIKTSKRRTELVTDFRCSLESDRTKCFWKPVNESVKLNISYRTSDKHDKIRACDGSTGHEKNVCYLNVNNLDFGIYVLVETETGCNTLKPKFVIPLPKMNITEDQGNLHLTWERSGPAVGNCGLNYSVWITECNNVRTLHTIKQHLNIPYNKNCQYKFQYSVKTNQYCIFLFSDLSEVVTHGENRSPDEKLIVIAIVVPIILSVCVILSCYCFQRNREIFCPRIPDPSTIFKEMMMTGSRDSKPIPGNLYTPVPEPTEHITLVSENTVPQENS